MKRITVLMLSLCIMLCFVACSDNQNSNGTDTETQYYNYAQECIAKNDIATAISALEEGIVETDSQKLKDLLETLTSSECTNSTDSASDTASVNPDGTSEVQNSNQQQVTNTSEVTSSEEKVPEYLPLTGTSWIRDWGNGNYNVLDFIDEGVVKYSVYNSGTMTYEDRHNYAYDGKRIEIKNYHEVFEEHWTDVKYITVIKAHSELKFSLLDIIRIDGEPGFMTGYWEYYESE